MRYYYIVKLVLYIVVVFAMISCGGQGSEYPTRENTITKNKEKFIITIDVPNDYDTINIPTDISYVYDYTIDWGDGTINYNQTTDANHTYSTSGDYVVQISGQFPTIRQKDCFVKDNCSIKRINNWGNISWSSMKEAFCGCRYILMIADDKPNLSSVTDMSFMFYGDSKFQAVKNINDWNVSNIENMRHMFTDNTKFNQDISSWNTSHVTNMEHMFYGASSFSQDLSSWNVSSVTSHRDFALDSGGVVEPIWP